MYERLEKCPACNHQTITNAFICQDHSVSEESFAIMQCNNCELKFTNPRPSHDTIAKYYASKNYISHTNKAYDPIQMVYKLVRRYTTQHKINILRKYAEGNKLLDYGCGTGHFLDAAKKAGYQINGLEPNESARNQAAKQTGISIHSHLSDIQATNSMNIITAWHVVEHIHDLKSTLKKLFELLTSDGTLILALPNYKSYDAKHYGPHWAGYDVPRHLYHFSQSSIISLIENLGFKYAQTLPMVFDAYYVSLLSEKYLTGNNNYFNAMKIGYKSNKLAKETSEYSSLIYIFHK